MELHHRITEIQSYLNKQNIDGWLLYDNHGSNRFIHQLLSVSTHQVLTRRFFYWIPKSGEPHKILHKIEAEALDNMPGVKDLYLSWHELEANLKQVLKGSKKVLMEYSPEGANPYVSVVDAGTVEMVRKTGVQVVSSADLLQQFTSVLDDDQIVLHLEAAAVLQAVVDKAWDLISDSLRQEKRITEYDVQNFILSEFAANRCRTSEGPICAVNEHTALPHYIATKQSAHQISRGDFILIDLWCKKDVLQGIYADITRVAIASAEPLPKHQEIFAIVQTAQQKAIEFIRERIESGQEVKGSEVDDVCRGHIQACGFADNFTHRTGHNIDIQVHGAGAHLDNLETADNRLLLPGMCFSIEPGIYLVENFGIRLETNLLIKHNRSVQVTGGIEENIVCLL